MLFMVILNQIIFVYVMKINVLYYILDKLIDYGNCILLSHIMMYFDNFNVQSVGYRSPEILFGLPFDNKIDIWSIGCIILELILGKEIFSNITQPDQAFIQILKVFFLYYSYFNLFHLKYLKVVNFMIDFMNII